MSPVETLKPANSIVASLGIGMQALSSTIRMKTPITPDGVDEVGGDVDDRVDDRRGRQHRRQAEQVHAGRGGYPPTPPSAAVHSTGHASPDRPREQAACARIRRRRGPRGARVRPRLHAAVPRRRRPASGPLPDDAARVRRLRRDRQGARDRALRAPPAVVALLPAPRPVAAVPRAGGRDRADGPGLRAGEALLVQPAALGDHPRLHPRLRAARRRPARPPLARRAPDAPGARRRRGRGRCWWSAPAPAGRWWSAS